LGNLTANHASYNFSYNFLRIKRQRKKQKRKVKTMATKAAQTRLNNVPGTIYLNKNRYWYKVQLPGEPKPSARPLKSVGATFATTDYSVAVELAKNLYQQSIYQNCTGPIETVKPIEDQYVYAILPYTTPVVAAMIELQLLTGMRPAELSMMRPCDIDRTKEIWHYTPQHHKTSYRQIERIVSIGPRGQEILRSYLLRPAEAYCFSPIESEKYRRAKMTENRTTPPSHVNSVGSNRKEKPQVQPGNCYDSESYRKAITHAIRAANKAIWEQAKQQGIKNPKLIPDWTPYRMRHTAATKVRKEMGYETAGATLGHTNMSAMAIYAERNQGLADEAARRLG
jgi:integrase